MKTRLAVLTTLVLMSFNVFSQITINTNTLWTSKTSNIVSILNSAQYGITIANGGSLTIQGTYTNSFVLAMDQTSNITIEVGGKLTLSYCNIYPNYNSWRGIIVKGNPNTTQNIKNQGYLVVKDSSDIQKAEIGVNVLGGGIIIANKAKFTDCFNSLKFNPYSYINKSKVLNCQFLNTSLGLNQHQVELYSVNDIHFYDNLFSQGVNSLSNNPCYPRSNPAYPSVTFYDGYRGSGIYSYNSSFQALKGYFGPSEIIKEPCVRNGPGNTFERFEMAIEVVTNNLVNNNLVIADNTFINNYYSIFFNGNKKFSNTIIFKNTFLLKVPILKFQSAIYLNKSLGHKIFENDITINGSNCTSCSNAQVYGIRIFNDATTVDDSTNLYKNSIKYINFQTKIQTYGIYINYPNIQKLESNEFYSLDYAVYIDNRINAAFTQGNNLVEAGNKFIGTKVYSIFNNTGQSFIYYINSSNPYLPITYGGTSFKFAKALTVNSSLPKSPCIIYGISIFKEGNQFRNYYTDKIGPSLYVAEVPDQGIYLVKDDAPFLKFDIYNEPIQLKSTLNNGNKVSTRVIIFPNPTTGIFTITYSENTKQLQIFDLLGKLQFSTELNGGNKIDIDISSLQKGIYLLYANGIPENKIIKK